MPPMPGIRKWQVLALAALCVAVSHGVAKADQGIVNGSVALGLTDFGNLSISALSHDPILNLDLPTGLRLFGRDGGDAIINPPSIGQGNPSEGWGVSVGLSPGDLGSKFFSAKSDVDSFNNIIPIVSF